MIAVQANLLQFLSVPKQLLIPIYQRTYSWTRTQCLQLWQDIERVAQDESIPAHFIGSVVYIQEGIYQATTLPQMLVIDGQQRLTTVSLLLLAISNAISNDAVTHINRDMIRGLYLFNTYGKGDQKYKIILTQSDKESFVSLLDGRELDNMASYHVIDNYHYFVDLIKKSALTLDEIYHGVNKLVVVDVSLDRHNDNPQLIFESLNSTGLDLTQADLIRNYVLMGMTAEQQADVYNRYWFPMEQRFGKTEYARLFDRFMRDYLTIKSDAGTIPNIGGVYSEFKKYIRGKDITEVVKDIALFSRYFARLAFPERNEDKSIRTVLENINTLKVDVAYPLLLEVFEDFERYNLLTYEDFIEILTLIESYVMRRTIVGIPTNSMNKTFATFKRSVDKSDYLNSVKYGFITLDSYRRFPRDDEFMTEYVTKDIYNLLQRRNYLLSKLENHERKEKVTIEEYTIEHILPQNPDLSIEWRQALGDNWKEIQTRYLHTIGNLTLTGYNPELSDRPFAQKRDMEGGFAHSPLKLNSGLGELEVWGAEQIKKRAQSLAVLALDIWRYPNMSDEVIKSYSKSLEVQTDESSSAHFEYLQGESLSLFEVLRRRVLNLDSSVREEFKRLYIAYKTSTNFVDIIPQKSRLRLSINMRFDEIDDPKGLCRDITDVSGWGNGDVEVGFSSHDEIDYMMFLIRQSFEKHTDDITI